MIMKNYVMENKVEREISAAYQKIGTELGVKKDNFETASSSDFARQSRPNNARWKLNIVNYLGTL